MNPHQPSATWMAMQSGRIVALGSNDDPPAASRTIDLEQRVVSPGFHDAHCHTAWFGLSLGELDCSLAGTLEELYNGLAKQAAALPPGEWVLATGYNQERFAGEYPDIAALDRAVPGHPVLIRHTSGHACIVNSFALELSGVDRLEGVSGGAVVRDATGRPTGLLEETAQTVVQSLLLPKSRSELRDAIARASAVYASEGLTSFTETGVAGGWIGHSSVEVAVYQDAVESGRLLQRAQLMVVSDAFHSLDEHRDDGSGRGLDAGIRTGLGDDRLQIGPMKIFLDGSMLAWTGAMSEPFAAGPADNYGYFQAPESELRDHMLDAAAAGWAIGAHAIGDRAVALALDTFDEAISRYGPPRMPHRIEHGGVVTDRQVTQAAHLGVAIITQPGFMPELGRQMREAMGPAREATIHRHRSLLDAGVIAAGSSDRPVATGRPLDIIQSMVRREDQSGVVVGPDERVSVEQALWTYTVGSARATGTSRDRGMLAPGMLADFVELSADPREVATEEISQIQVVRTWVDGDRVYLQ